MLWISISRILGRSGDRKVWHEIKEALLNWSTHIHTVVSGTPLCPVGQEQTTFPNWKQKTDMNVKICSGWLDKNKKSTMDDTLNCLFFKFKLNLLASFLTVCIHLIQTRCLAKWTWLTRSSCSLYIWSPRQVRSLEQPLSKRKSNFFQDKIMETSIDRSLEQLNRVLINTDKNHSREQGVRENGYYKAMVEQTISKSFKWWL